MQVTGIDALTEPYDAESVVVPGETQTKFDDPVEAKIEDPDAHFTDELTLLVEPLPSVTVAVTDTGFPTEVEIVIGEIVRLGITHTTSAVAEVFPALDADI